MANIRRPKFIKHQYNPIEHGYVRPIHKQRQPSNPKDEQLKPTPTPKPKLRPRIIKARLTLITNRHIQISPKFPTPKINEINLQLQIKICMELFLCVIKNERISIKLVLS